jgi:penicillin-binding protein 1A
MRGGVTPFRYFWQTHPEMAEGLLRESPEYRKAVEAGEPAAVVLKRLAADGTLVARLRAARTRLEAGFVALEPGSGAVRAWVGSRDFAREQYDHVAQAARQPGSTFKPIVYGAALEKGLLPDRPYLDAVTDIKAGDGSVWRPTDMSGSSGKMLTLRDGLVYSKNTITAQVMQDVGLPSVIKLARAMGIRTSKLDPVPSLALGTSPVTLLEMVSAYTTIAAAGEYRAPMFVTSITDRSGREVARFAPDKPQRAMSAASAATLLDMMRGVINKGTGTAIRYRFGINADVAGKTGTTQNNTDGWFILMHQNIVAGAWVGFNDARVTMRSSYWGQGGHNAVLLVGDFFRAALDAGKVDTSAFFPGGKPAPAPRPAAPVEVAEPDTLDAPDMPQDEGPAPSAPIPETAPVFGPGPGGQPAQPEQPAPPSPPQGLPDTSI